MIRLARKAIELGKYMCWVVRSALVYTKEALQYYTETEKALDDMHKQVFSSFVCKTTIHRIGKDNYPFEAKTISCSAKISQDKYQKITPNFGWLIETKPFDFDNDPHTKIYGRCALIPFREKFDWLQELEKRRLSQTAEETFRQEYEINLIGVYDE